MLGGVWPAVAYLVIKQPLLLNYCVIVMIFIAQDKLTLMEKYILYGYSDVSMRQVVLWSALHCHLERVVDSRTIRSGGQNPKKAPPRTD